MKKYIYPLNLKVEDFCKRVGLAYHSTVLQKLRELYLVTFFKVRTKYFYASEDAVKISDILRKGEIQIKSDKGYYITLK